MLGPVSAPASAVGHAARVRRAAGYETERPDVQAHVPRDARRVLDLGCSTGALGAALKRRQDAIVVGIELDADYAAQAAARLDRVVAGDVELVLDGPAPPEAPFDCLVAADILEHLVDPWRALRRGADLLAAGATVVVSLPNVAHYVGIWRLLRGGRWPRDDAGVFDRTHLRWFTLEDGLDLLRQAGLRPTAVEPRYWTDGWHLRWRQAAARTPLQPFLAPQYVLCAVKDGPPRTTG